MSIKQVLEYFPNNIESKILNSISDYELNIIQEIRIRNNFPLILNLGQAEKIIDYKIEPKDIDYIFQKICENSIYSYQNQIVNGFITLPGGDRVGLTGTAVLKDEKIINFNYISSLNFRISRQIIGCSNTIINEIINEDTIYNTLIVSEPGKGKTTLLRDIVRNISNGIEGKFNGLNVSVIDERGEISATYKGCMKNDLGIRTDVISDIPKSIGLRMAIRSMAPKVVVADEIGSRQDVEAIKFALCCGVKGIFTAHGKNIEDICKNLELNDLIKNKIFDKIIRIEGKNNFICERI